MNTPVCDFVARYASGQPVRLHMPGHKGAPLLGMEPLDITEIPGADVLYHESGILRESQRNASVLFGTQKTLYSTEGSSLPIRAMLYLAALYAGRLGRPAEILAGRNAHKVFITGAALMDIRVQWLFPQEQENFVSCTVSPSRLEAYLKSCGKRFAAVYVTSPDYLGNMADIREISRVCHKYGCLLLVDNAHGAYLNCLGLHPMALGADMCCDSAHKTLPVLTGGAYLHISAHAPAMLAELAEMAMGLFASTSPSYLILQSLDRVNADLAAGFGQKLLCAKKNWDDVKGRLREAGFRLEGQEPMKLTIAPKSYGYTGEEMAEYLESRNIFSEFFDPDHLVLMLPAEDTGDSEKLLAALLALPPRQPITAHPPRILAPELAMCPHRALFSPSREIAVHNAGGKIVALPSVSCPPAIPIVCLGERIAPWAVEAMDYYGMERIRVVEEEDDEILC